MHKMLSVPCILMILNIPWAQFCDEKWRLHTFANYPRDAAKSAILLAKAGFVYIGSGGDADDTVICFSCRQVKRSWQEGEDIGETHRHLSCDCIMVTGNGGDNIPLIAQRGPICMSQHNQGQASDESAPSAILTSGSTVPVHVVTEAALRQTNSVPHVKRRAQQFEQRASCLGASGGTDTEPIGIRTISQNPSYNSLGIVTESPKMQEYVDLPKRLETFGNWPVNHHLRKEDLASRGFYYTGYKDLVQCFYCGGGLKNWQLEDDVLVEHARYFPKCGFIRHKFGQVFVDTVKLLAERYDKVTLQMVARRMNISLSALQTGSRGTPLESNAAVVAVREMGYHEADILPVAQALEENGQILTADSLYTELVEKGVLPVHQSALASNPGDREQPRSYYEDLFSAFKQENRRLRLITLCKICMSKEVELVFIPCGHLICCSECVSALNRCPVCQENITGIVRAFWG